MNRVGMTLQAFYDIYNLAEYGGLDDKEQALFRKRIPRAELDSVYIEAYGEGFLGVLPKYSKDKKIHDIKLYVETMQRTSALARGLMHI